MSVNVLVSAEDYGSLSSVCHLFSISSAGVGRTGTFIVIDAMIEMMHEEQKIDVFGFVSKIREQRSQLIQTDVSWGRIMLATWRNANTWHVCGTCELSFTVNHLQLGPCIVCVIHLCVFSLQMQYSFIYQALLEYYLYGDTELDVSSLEGHLQKLHNTFNDGDRIGLEEEFKVEPLFTFRPIKDPI